ncbi:hypothetical protein FRB96_005380 [Tulasnella sp. 330]|nr:hypothetical protein FRB96_005380 [Tulasnella sp. 330]KAG8877135.1 hypothetical protein FRB97_003664 [Tulasnella sp. 331]KAG8886302.1 hypothetical protein FRB98_001322 [Tulasnella sp. 332]
MRSILLIALATLFFASLSFARIFGITAPATVKKGDLFKVAFQTEGYVEHHEDAFVFLGFTSSPCDTCIGTPAGSFDLVSQGHAITGHGSFSETIKAPTAKGAYNVTAAITVAVGASDEIGLHFFTAPIKVTH